MLNLGLRGFVGHIHSTLNPQPKLRNKHGSKIKFTKHVKHFSPKYRLVCTVKACPKGGKKNQTPKQITHDREKQ